MNEEIEYAEMLEIPVSTVNIVRKNQRRKKVKVEQPTENLQNVRTVITQIINNNMIIRARVKSGMQNAKLKGAK